MDKEAFGVKTEFCLPNKIERKIWSLLFFEEIYLKSVSLFVFEIYINPLHVFVLDLLTHYL